jgi:hypothetical protein
VPLPRRWLPSSARRLILVAADVEPLPNHADPLQERADAVLDGLAEAANWRPGRLP